MAVNALEWLDGNMHRNYPVADDCTCMSNGGIALPSSFLVDIDINVPVLPENDAEDRFFISSIARTGSELRIEFSYHADSDDIVCGLTGPISLDIRNTTDVESRTVAINPYGELPSTHSELSNISGNVIIGTCLDMQDKGAMTFPWSSGGSRTTNILSVRVHVTSFGLHQVIADDTYGGVTAFTNDFVLTAGPGIRFTTTTDGNGNVNLVVEREATASGSGGPQSVEDVVNAVLSMLGTPIRRINGIAPDDNGTFTIGNGDCTQVTPMGNGVAIANPCSTPCCSDASPSDVQTALNVLKEAEARLLEYYTGMAANINDMQSRLAALIAAGRTGRTP